MNDRFLAWRITPEFIISIVVGIISLMTAKLFGHDTIALYILIILAGWLLVRIDTLRSRIKNKEAAIRAMTHIVLRLAMTGAFREDIVAVADDGDNYTITIKAAEDTSLSFSIPREEIDGSERA